MDIVDYAGPKTDPGYASRWGAALTFVFAPILCFGAISAYEHFWTNQFEPDFGNPGRSFIFSIIMLSVMSLLCGVGYLLALWAYPRVPVCSKRHLRLLSVVLGLSFSPVTGLIGHLSNAEAIRTSSVWFGVAIGGPVVATGILCAVTLYGLRHTSWLWPKATRSGRTGVR